MAIISTHPQPRRPILHQVRHDDVEKVVHRLAKALQNLEGRYRPINN